MALTSVAEFFDVVRKSGVLDEQRFAEHFPDEADWPTDAQAFAQVLVNTGLLTPFQARQLLAGKFRGFVLGAYKILRPIGQGGMGAVYLAEHTTLRRQVALKVLPAAKAKDQLAVERFYREARAAAALDHPNIVRLHDVSQGAGVHFLVMEYVEGKDLHSLVAETGPLHFAQAAHYAAQAAAGLQHAHEKGFVHRDIKPANLILAKDGTVKILDMGLARSFQDEVDNLTAQLGDGEVAGTADYISPEQSLGQPVDERGDIYSLGATLFALITGKPPFKGATVQVLMQHQMAELPRLTKKLKVSVPPELYDLIGKMMAKKKADRPRACTDVIDALSPWLPAQASGNLVLDPLSTQDLRAAGVPTAWTSRRAIAPPAGLSRATKLGIGGAGALGLILAALLLVGGTRTQKDPNVVEQAPVETGKAPAGAGSPEAPRPGAGPVMAREVRGVTYVRLTHAVTGKVLSTEDGPVGSAPRPVGSAPRPWAILVAETKNDPAQQWRLEDDGFYCKLMDRKSGLALDVNYASLNEGEAIILFESKKGEGDDNNQRWVWDGDGKVRRLRSKLSGHVLDVDGEGRAVQMRADESTRQQFWKVSEVKD